MPLTLNGTTGIAGVDGSASTPSVQGSDTNTGEFFPAADTIAWTTGGSERMRVDSSGNVGIGTSSLASDARLVISKNGAAGLEFSIDNATAGVNRIFSYNRSTSAGVPIAFNAGSGEAMRIDSSGNVGIGTSSPNAKLQTSSNGGSGTTTKHIQLQSDNGSDNVTLRIAGAPYTGTAQASIDFNINAGSNFNSYMAFGTSAGSGTTERMRIDSSGNLLVGTTTRASVEKVNITHDGNSQEGLIFVNTTGVSSTQTAIGFRRPSGTTVGTITTTTSTTAYNTSSDYRLKNSVAPLSSGLSTISALKPVSYKWNVDDSVGEGFIAHELAEHIPLAVAGEKDAVDAEGNIKPQGVDYSKIVVHLVAAVQELSAKVDAQAAEIAALKANAPA